jgi:ParB/RepB/Spo0J family partition protein
MAELKVQNPIQSPEIPTVDIPLEKIVPDFSFNARTPIMVDEDGKTEAELKKEGHKPKGTLRPTYHGVDDMVASLKREGQLSSIKVRSIPGTDKYAIVFGFTRFLAAKQICEESKGKKFSTISAQVENLDDKEAAKQNIAENVIRDNLRPVELAKRCSEIQAKYKITGTEIAASGNKTRQYINRLIATWENLTPAWRKAWEEGEDWLPSDYNELNKISKMDKKDQEAEYKTWSGGDEEGEDKEGGEREARPGGNRKRPSIIALKKWIKAVKADETNEEEWKNGALAALQAALGIKTAAKVFDEMMVEEDEDSDD